MTDSSRECEARGDVPLERFEVAVASTDPDRPARDRSARAPHPGVHLTPAESKVLALLPTHLNLTEIAEQLGCRRSTVKTHVARIHAKLGAKTRRVAVERAREAGLLRDPDAGDRATRQSVVAGQPGALSTASGRVSRKAGDAQARRPG
jgi:DNA-binding CsgD family transcriptional regulator